MKVPPGHTSHVAHVVFALGLHAAVWYEPTAHVSQTPQIVSVTAVQGVMRYSLLRQFEHGHVLTS
jgi:hypothetical protein